MKETHGETTEEDYLAKRALKMFGDEWPEKFTREWLARELRQSSTSKSTRKKYWNIVAKLSCLQPPRQTSAGQQPSASSASAPCASESNSRSSSPAVHPCHFEALGLPIDKDVTWEAVRKAYTTKLQKSHPDKVCAGLSKEQASTMEEQASTMTRQIIEAEKAFRLFFKGSPAVAKDNPQNTNQKRKRDQDKPNYSRPVKFVKEGDAPLADATCFPNRDPWHKGTGIPGLDGLPWLGGRVDYLQHHIDLEDEHSHKIQPKDTHQISILAVNMGNLNRHGDVHGFHQDNAILAYLCGKFHLVLVTEAFLDDRARMTPRTFNVSVFESKSRCQAIWVLGNGKNRRCKILAQDTIKSNGKREEGTRNWHLDYMVGEAFWGDHGSTDHPVLRCGIKSLRCGVAHLNNNSANKKREVLLIQFWETMVHNRAQVVFGDFNKRAYLNIHQKVDRLNNTMKQFLEVVISRCQVPIQFLMLRVDAGTRPEEQILACRPEDDTMLVFLLNYDDSEFKITKLWSYASDQEKRR